MASAAFPLVVDASLDTAESALRGVVRVVRGPDLSADPDDVALIGVQDITEARGDASATTGSFQQEMQTFGGNRREAGTVNGLIQAWGGDSDQGAAFDAAFGYLSLIEAAVRADPSMGVTGVDYLVAELSSGDVIEFQDSQGSGVALTFVIQYKARI